MFEVRVVAVMSGVKTYWGGAEATVCDAPASGAQVMSNALSL